MNDQMPFTQSVLIVDDDPMTTELFGEILGEQFDIQIAHTICEAQKKIITGNIGIVLSDYHFGRQTAEDFFAWLLGTQPELAKRFVLLTGDQVTDLSHFEAIATVLYKPIPIATLLKTIEQVSVEKGVCYDAVET